MDFILIVIAIFWITNFILFNFRRNHWVKSKYKWYAVLTLLIIGVVLLLTYKSKNYQVYLLFVCITTPALYSFIDYCFERWSFALHDRDFYLWIRGSSDLRSNEIKFKASDRIFSILLLYVSLGTPALPILLIKAI
jgi:hypothetical protein